MVHCINYEQVTLFSNGALPITILNAYIYAVNLAEAFLIVVRVEMRSFNAHFHFKCLVGIRKNALNIEEFIVLKSIKYLSFYKHFFFCFNMHPFSHYILMSKRNPTGNNVKRELGLSCNGFVCYVVITL